MTRIRQTIRLLVGATALVALYAVLVRYADASRAVEVLMHPGEHTAPAAIFVLLLCIAVRMITVVLLPGLLLARLWMVWALGRDRRACGELRRS